MERPEAVKDLAVAQIGRTLEIRFTLPRLATDGERLKKPLEIELLRSATPPGNQPSQPQEVMPWIDLPANQTPRYVVGERIVYPVLVSDQEFGQLQGQTLAVAVRTLTRGFRHRALESELSNIFQFPLMDVSGPVENLKPRTTEKAIELEWTSPTQSLGGRPLGSLAGYRIYRSRTGKPGSFALLGESTSAPYLDRNFEFGQAYFYKVRAIFKDGGRTAESEDSLPAGTTPLDIFPPATPSNLTSVYAAGAVELVWTANTEGDFAGYNVYRRENQEPARRLNQEVLPTPIFRDTTAEPGHSYTYWVTAVDLSKNESPPSVAVVVEAK